MALLPSCPPNEVSPLLEALPVDTPVSNSSSIKNHVTIISNPKAITFPQRILALARTARRLSILIVVVTGLIFFFFFFFFFLFVWTPQLQQQQQRKLQSLVRCSESGQCLVTAYPRNLTATDTFATLAQLMVPVWYEASLLSLSVFHPAMEPSEVRGARKCLLTTRDLLDVFAPVYSNSNRTTRPPTAGSRIFFRIRGDDTTASYWQLLRKFYKEGYELAGSFQDLYDGNVTYNEHLWTQRREKVLAWKVRFLNYERWHSNRLRNFLLHPSPTGCFDHREHDSHLFWDYSSKEKSLKLPHNQPCGDDLATSTLQQLAVVQLRNALGYLTVILQYDTVSSRSHQLMYHNLRKELRSFLDEYTLFDFVLFPKLFVLHHDEHNIAENIDTLVQARLLLGELNDHWEAYNLYREKGLEHEHFDLVSSISNEWNVFKDWCFHSNLAGTIESLIHTLTTN